MSSIDCIEKLPSSATEELQFPMDDYQAITGTSTVEKTVSSMQQNDTADEIWRSINSNRDCLPKNRGQGLERAPTLKCVIGAEEEIIVPTSDRDSSKRLQLQFETDKETEETDGGRNIDGEFLDKEKSGRGGSVENKSSLKPSPSVGISLIQFVPEASCAKSNGPETGCYSMMDDAWERLRLSFVYFQKQPVGTLAAVDPSAEDLNYNQARNIRTVSLMISMTFSIRYVHLYT